MLLDAQTVRSHEAPAPRVCIYIDVHLVGGHDGSDSKTKSLPLSLLPLGGARTTNGQTLTLPSS